MSIIFKTIIFEVILLKAIGAKLKELRLRAKMSEKEIAEKLGVDIRTYRKYEKGESKLPIRRLIGICLIYRVSADYILGLKGDTN